MKSLPFIFDIRRGALEDGPGIRTTVFFKGCPLACIWCHNPESMLCEAEISYSADRCIGSDCGACGAVCPAAGSKRGMAGSGESRCSACGECAAVCPSGARWQIGRVYPLNELCTLLLKDIIFYNTSRGGVTLSGGEPALHHHYVRELLKRLKSEGVHTAIQTCGLFDMEQFSLDLLPRLDIIYFDLKLMDPVLHRRYTGRSNASILANLSALSRLAPERLVVRVPLVPDITATSENLLSIAAFLRDLHIKSWELLPYNPGGIAKRKSLSRELSPAMPEHFMGADEEERFLTLFRQAMSEQKLPTGKGDEYADRLSSRSNLSGCQDSRILP